MDSSSSTSGPPNIPLNELVNEPLIKGDTWYLLDRSWYDMCQSFHESKDPTFHPGPIDNSALFQPLTSSTTTPSPTLGPLQPLSNGQTSNESKFKAPTGAVSMGNRPLRSDLSEAEGHFILVPEKCWNLLKEAYGILSPNHTIKRKVIEQSPGKAVVEIHPINLKLCLYGGKEATVEKHFSRLTTMDELQQEMRHLFNIPSDSETKLWINSTVFTFRPTSNNTDSISSNELSPSKSENNLNNQQLTLPTIASTLHRSPPTLPPPPSPASSTPLSVTISSPTVVTRQAAKSANKPIPLPDASSSSTTPSTTRSSNLSTSTSDSPLSIVNSSTTTTKENSPTTTLADACVSDQAVVTLEVINSDGTWPSSRPRFGSVSTRSSKAQPGLCGLSNMGNTCFMNAALQCLSNTPPLTNYILTDKFIYDINPDNPLGMHGEIARTYADLIKVMWSGNNTSFLPREFKCAVSRFAPQFNGFAQQDSQELMAFLLDGLHEDLNRIRNKPYIEIKNEIERRPDEVVAAESWANYKKRNDSIVVDTFHAMLKSTLVCPGCKLVSVTFDPFCYLSLPLPVKREKQVSLVFLPAPNPIDETLLEPVFAHLDAEEVETIRKYGASISSFNATIDEHGCFLDSTNRPKLCKLQVPQSGPASEICDIVARVMNEERPSNVEKIRPDNLLVVELAGDGKICKVYESNEHYQQINDIIVVEKKSKYAIPLYLRERKSSNTNTGSVISKPLFVHVADLKFETLYKSIIASLSNLTIELHKKLANRKLTGETDASDVWYKIGGPCDVVDKIKHDDDDDDQMDCDDDTSTTNGLNPRPRGIDGEDTTEAVVTDSDVAKTNGSITPNRNAFELSVVNSFGNHIVENLDQKGKPREYTSKLYLSATFTLPPATSFTSQFAHLRNIRNGDSVALFVPKVTVKPTLRLKDCISQFTSVEKLGADDPWYCPKCKKHQQATKKFDIWSLPKVLIIHLKRFSFSRSWRDKIDTLVEFPVEGLDMSKYVLNPKQRQRSQVYNLIGVSNHFGGLGGGHYTAYAKNSAQNAWYSFDDALVTQTSANNVVTRSAYVLFYQLQEDTNAD